MNHIYRCIWNEALGTWVAVSELAKSRSKCSKKRTTLLVTGLFVYSTAPVWALPTGNQLVAGQAAVSLPNASTMQINQASQKAVINWQGFSVAQHEAVNIQQPNRQAALLNRVVGQDASKIQGKINANGQVYLVNPNGVMFSKTAQVDVGGLVATTHNISNQDFINGKNRFTQNGAKGVVENHGTIKTSEQGVVALIGEKVTNTGTINTAKGTTALAAGKTVDLDFKGDGLVEVKVSEAALNAQITNRGAIQADGGRVVMTTKAAGQLIDTVINQEGIVRAQGMVERNGEIILEGGYVAQTGQLDVSGNQGGKVAIKARSILDAGQTNADGKVGNGGQITMQAEQAMVQTANANTHANGNTNGGQIQLASNSNVYSSGKLSAIANQQGGTIDVLAKNQVTLASAELDTSGKQQGGLIRVGGDFHGANSKLSNAKKTTVSHGSKLKANGGQGKVVVWSNEKTDYFGDISANKKGEIEVSSKGTLVYGGSADAGVGGHLLLDPTDIIITNNAGPAKYDLVDPNPSAGNLFGLKSTLLGTTDANDNFTENGNIAIASPFDDLAAADAGAVYLFNTTTGIRLLSVLTGSTANDNVGSNGITALTNGNYVVSSANWNNGTNTNAGAATWGNGLTGVNGIVSSANSLIGSNLNDAVSSNGITALTTGNYVVSSSNWSNGSNTSVGAVTWGNGVTGTSGVVNAVNSLIGSNAFDSIGNGGITVLPNNSNYVISSPNWNASTGAVTWANGSTGIAGVVSSTNSLIGANGAVTALTNGNYVVASPSWTFDSFCTPSLGAVTWGSGTLGVKGLISATNSLVGSSPNDFVGLNGVTALNNGHYVIGSSNWDNTTLGIANAGAATWGNGLTGIVGTINVSNSLIGSTTDDFVSSNGINALTNGHYVVRSALWDNSTTGISNVGAATWGNGNIGITGTISTSNSLIGSNTDDNVSNGDFLALNNGNYVLGSYNWHSSSLLAVGAVTWGNGVTGVKGFISSNNSLVGSSAFDLVGNFSSFTELTNNNYVISTPNWDNGSILNAGAVTWANGAIAITGTISSTNSLIGSSNFDGIGNNGVVALTNGNYVVSSPDWDNNGITDAGAATWGNGLTGISGIVSSTNSLVGSSAFDYVSGSGSSTIPIILAAITPNTHKGIIALTNGNYVVSSPYWDNNGILDAGAATWGNGSTGISGAVTSSNSLVGSTNFDYVSGGFNSNQSLTNFAAITSLPTDGVIPLPNGNYLVRSVFWSNGSIVSAGAITWGHGLVGITGLVDTRNSLTGAATFDFSDSIIHALNNGNYIVAAGYWDTAGNVNAGQAIVATPNSIFFDNGFGQNMSFNPSTITTTLALGTDITLEATNDITLDTGTDIIVSGSNGGTLSLQAGRDIILNSSIFTANGNFTAVSGDPTVPGTSSITLGPGATIDAGTGKVILAAVGGNFINNSGFSSPINAAQWWIYSTSPNQDQLNGMTASRHYAQPYIAGSTPSYATTGNWFLYTITPILNVTPNNTAITYGSILPTFTPSFTGFLTGDTSTTAGISGSSVFDITNFTGNVGKYDVKYLSGLTSSLGYLFIDNSNSIDELTVIPAPLEITANNQTKNYGQTFMFNGTEFASVGLQNGETIGSVALSSSGIPATASVTTSPYLITASNAIGGSFNPSNYSITYKEGLLTVTPAALTVIANDASKTYGQPLIFMGTEFSSIGLQNGETLSTVNLATTGSSITASVLGSPYSIIVSNANGTGFNPSNYTITYQNGSLTVNPAPLFIFANNAIKTYGQSLFFTGTEFFSLGLINGESIGLVDLNSLGTLANASIANSPYPIHIANARAGSFDANNYDIHYFNGSLIIKSANNLSLIPDDVVTPLQQSTTVFLPWIREKIADGTAMLDIRNEGLKLPEDTTIISLSTCTTGTRYLPN